MKQRIDNPNMTNKPNGYLPSSINCNASKCIFIT